MGKQWATHDDKELAEMAGVLTTQQAAERTGRTESAIRYRAHKLGLSFARRGQDHHASKLEESDFPLIILLSAEKLTQKQIANKFDVTSHTIGLILRGEYPSTPPLKTCNWTPEDDATLEQYAHVLTSAQLGVLLRRSAVGIKKRAKRLGVELHKKGRYHQSTKLTPEVRQRVNQLYNYGRGMTQTQIAREMGICERSVWACLHPKKETEQ